MIRQGRQGGVSPTTSCCRGSSSRSLSAVMGGLLDSSPHKPAIAAGEASLVRRCLRSGLRGLTLPYGLHARGIRNNSASHLTAFNASLEWACPSHVK